MMRYNRSRRFDASSAPFPLTEGGWAEVRRCSVPYVQAGDVRLHYVEHGSGPEPLVFIHGYTSSTNNWIETLPRLPDRYRAYAFDLRGAGESDGPASGYGPAIYAEDIHLATKALGLDTFTCIGHSMGGLTGMQFAVSHPERLRKLVLVAPAPSGGLASDPELRVQMKAMRGDRDAMRAFWENGVTVRPLGEDFLRMAVDDDLKWPEAAWEEAWQAMVNIRLSEAITRIETPTLMVAGDRDFLRTFNLEDAARIPNCALQVFYRAGHLVPFDVPDAFVALLDDFIQHGVAPASQLLTDPAAALDALSART